MVQFVFSLVQVHFTIRTVGCCYIWLKKTVLSLSFSQSEGEARDFDARKERTVTGTPAKSKMRKESSQR